MPTTLWLNGQETTTLSKAECLRQAKEKELEEAAAAKHLEEEKLKKTVKDEAAAASTAVAAANKKRSAQAKHVRTKPRRRRRSMWTTICPCSATSRRMRPTPISTTIWPISTVAKWMTGGETTATAARRQTTATTKATVRRMRTPGDHTFGCQSRKRPNHGKRSKLIRRKKRKRCSGFGGGGHR